MPRQLSAFGLVVMLLLVATAAAIGGSAAAVFTVKHLSDAEPKPVPAVPSSLVQQAEKAITVDGKVNKDHALYLSRLFQGISMRLVVDANSSHQFNTTGELVELVSNAGLFAVNGVVGFDYPALPEFIKEQVIVASFGSSVIDREVTVNETLEFANKLAKIGIAFNDISEK